MSDKPKLDFEGVLSQLNELVDEATAFVEEHKGDAASALAQIYARYKSVCDQFDEIEKKISATKNILKDSVIPDAFEREEIKTFTLKDGTRVTINNVVLASIKGDQKDLAYQWLRENGLSELIVPTVNASTLSATAKSLLKEGAELPEEYFNTHIGHNTSVTKPKR